MNPTNDSRIFETQWIPSDNALVERKYFYAKVGELVYVIMAWRGVGFETISRNPDDFNEPIGYMFNTDKGLEDNSGAQFAKLVRFLNKVK